MCARARLTSITSPTSQLIARACVRACVRVCVCVCVRARVRRLLRGLTLRVRYPAAPASGGRLKIGYLSADLQVM